MELEYTTTLSANEPIVITIGNFDGVHTGHQRLMHELGAMARTLGCIPVLVTFSPHTLTVVRPDIDLKCLTTLTEKLALAKRLGHINNNIVITFTPDVMTMSAYDFINTLCTRFMIRGMLVGANFSLGHKRTGNVTFLQQYGQQHTIEVRAIPVVEELQQNISSTRIRELVSAGQINEANELLGHPLSVSGIVVHGDHRGKLLGFPTANLALEPQKLLPANGVYAVHVYRGSTQERDSTENLPVYNGVVNIGIRPTFNGREQRVEVHILDSDLDLYDQRITIDFIARLRGEQRFADIEALKAQIASDVQSARQIVAVPLLKYTNHPNMSE